MENSSTTFPVLRTDTSQVTTPPGSTVIVSDDSTTLAPMLRR